MILRYVKEVEGITFFYVTPLGTDFLSPTIKDGMVRHWYLVDSLFNFAKKARSSLKIVIESNFHIYAFIPNSNTNLHVKILNLFVELRVCR